MDRRVLIFSIPWLVLGGLYIWLSIYGEFDQNHRNAIKNLFRKDTSTILFLPQIILALEIPINEITLRMAQADEAVQVSILLRDQWLVSCYMTYAIVHCDCSCSLGF